MGPREQDIDAFILTYRFFFDKKEHCSFRWLSDNLLDDDGLSEKWKHQFFKLRDELNNYLDSYPNIRVTTQLFPSSLKNRDIKDLFLFSDLSHATWDLEKRRKYLSLISEKATKGLLTTQFITILYKTFYLIMKLSDICYEELSRQGNK